MIREMRQPRFTFFGLTAAVVIAGLLAGCGGSDDDATVDSTTSAATTSVVTTVETTTAAPEPATTEPVATEAPATDATTTTALLSGGSSGGSSGDSAVDEGECLVGDWVVTDEQMDAFYAGLTGTLEVPLSIDTIGAAPLSFGADGTYAWAPGFELTVEVAGQSGTGDVAGAITGNWTAVDGVVTTFADVNALTVSIAVNGVTFGGDDLANGLLNSSPVNGVTYSCDGPTPVLDFQTGDPSVTVPVTLTPA